MGRKTLGRQRGFTLVEVLAAFAIASVIMMAIAALMHNIAFSFDRGTNRVGGAERLLLAADRLATDIGAARFVPLVTPAGPAAAFLGAPTKIMFIGAGGIDPGRRTNDGTPISEEVVSVTIEQVGDVTQVVRRRAPWRGPRTRFDNVLPGDEVVLVSGLFDASFAFARATPEGKFTWSDNWTGEPSLPRMVKLNLRERASGVDLFGGAEFVIHADAPPACARPGASGDCVTRGVAAQPAAAPAQAARPEPKEGEELGPSPEPEPEAEEEPEGPQQ